MPVERTIVEWKLDETSRIAIRTAVLHKWAEEKWGSADHYQRYRYNVENLSNGSRVFLHRPAWKNKGCDFEVRCEDPILRPDGKKQSRPSHSDLFSEFRALWDDHPQSHPAIEDAIKRVWNCENVDNACAVLLPQLSSAEWKLRAERALKIAKWLFIEQDITDWNTSGRAMLMGGIDEALSE